MKEEVQFLPLELRSLWKEDRIMSMCRGTVRKASGKARPASRDPRKPDFHRERLEMTGHQRSGPSLPDSSWGRLSSFQDSDEGGSQGLKTLWLKTFG